MISLKRNNKGELKEAIGLRKKKNSMYSPHQYEPFKISRSKFGDFLTCKRCFYLDRVKGLEQPKTPGWALNLAVDFLLKKEFDHYRKIQKPHPIMKKNNLNFVPFEHNEIDNWRDSLRGGISYLDKATNLIIYGGPDDIWYDLKSKQLVVVDYKAQSKKIVLEKRQYLNDPFHQGYKLQMDTYVHILRKMGFKTSDKSYFLVCNAEKTYEAFNAKLLFETKLIEYDTKTDWIDESIKDMKKILDSKELPKRNIHCENCAYLEQGGIIVN